VHTGLVFNRTYHARASRGGLVPVGEVIQELVERAADRRRKKHGAKLRGSLQLELFGDQPIPRDAERPLFDLIPEASTIKGL